MLGLDACHHINLQLFYKVTNPIIKEYASASVFCSGMKKEHQSIHA